MGHPRHAGPGRGLLLRHGDLLTIIDRGGPGWLYLLVLLFGWNALKFLWISPVSLIRLRASDHERTAALKRQLRADPLSVVPCRLGRMTASNSTLPIASCRAQRPVRWPDQKVVRAIRILPDHRTQAHTAVRLHTARLRRGARNLYQDWRVVDTRRRPQWRGERKAVLVRLPVDVADQLTRAAEASQLSVSDTAGKYISAGLATSEVGAKAK